MDVGGERPTTQFRTKSDEGFFFWQVRRDASCDFVCFLESLIVGSELKKEVNIRCDLVPERGDAS